MTQDEIWLKKYQEAIAFMEENHRKPSMHNPNKRYQFGNWIKHNRKLMKAGKLKEDRVEPFNRLLSLCEQYKHVNQYQ